MPRILAPLIIALFMFPAVAMGQALDFSDLERRDGIFFKKFTSVPFTGSVTGGIRGSFTNGKLDGPWVEYWGNGQVHSKGSFKSGKPVEMWVTYHENGQLLSQGSFNDGKPTGSWIWYTKSGRKVSTLDQAFKD
jgi:hypothetical protein